MYKYLLLGRTGSGRKFFQKLLKDKGYNIAKSYTTREPVDGNDSDHYYLSKGVKEPAYKILSTTHNDNYYFYSEDEIEKSDVIPIDPENIHKICAMYPEQLFRLIVIKASDTDRLTHAVKDAEDKLIAEEEFIAACKEENEAFAEFEDKISSNSLSIENIITGHVGDNDFTDTADIYGLINRIVFDKRVFTRTQKIINQLIENNQISRNENGDITVFMKDKGEQPIPLDFFTEMVLTDSEGTARIMTQWLGIENVSI